MISNEKELVTSVGELFIKYGIKSLTMDDISRHLGISKKTLYKYVEDKNDLVGKVLASFCEQDVIIVEEVMSRGLNAIDEQLEISKYINEKLTQIHPSVHYDLEKYHPVQWRTFLKEQGDVINRCILANMKNGIKEGLYRDDLNAEIVSKIYISRFDAVFDGELFPATDYKFTDVHHEFFRYHIRGIASKKGIKYLVEKVKKEKLKS